MRILIILPDYYPKQTPRVFRWKALAEYWSTKSYKVDVLCASHSECPAVENLQGVEVHRTGQGSMMDLIYNILNKKNRRREIQKGEHKGKDTKWEIWSLLGTIFHWVWKKIYWPDGTCLWINPAQKMAIKLFETNRYDIVVSVSLPFSSHLVGFSLKILHPKILWVVDIGDPFSTMNEFPKNNLFFYRRKNHDAEKRVLEHADSVVLTTEGALFEYKIHFPDLYEKMHVIPPLYSVTKGKQNQLIVPLQPSKINIGYFGSFYAGIRQPEAFLELFSQFIQFKPSLKKQLALHIYGYLEPEFKNAFYSCEYLYECLIIHGQIDKNEVAQIMYNCDFLVNIGNATSSQLPSKSVDYMMTGKPIINICQIKNDTFKDFFQDYPLILNLLCENGKYSKAQIKTLLDFLENKIGKTVEPGWLKKKAGDFSVGAIAQQYERLIIKTD